MAKHVDRPVPGAAHGERRTGGAVGQRDHPTRHHVGGRHRLRHRCAAQRAAEQQQGGRRTSRSVTTPVTRPGPGSIATSGYGRIDAARLVQWIAIGKIPPQAEIDGVPWYQVLSPSQQVTVSGVMGTTRSPSWQLRGPGGPASRRPSRRGGWCQSGTGTRRAHRCDRPHPAVATWPPCSPSRCKLDGSPADGQRPAAPRQVHVHDPGRRPGRGRHGRHGPAHRVPPRGSEPLERGTHGVLELDRRFPGACPHRSRGDQRPAGRHGRRHRQRLRVERGGAPGMAGRRPRPTPATTPARWPTPLERSRPYPEARSSAAWPSVTWPTPTETTSTWWRPT